MPVKDQMQLARQLIAEKRYDQARFVLNKIDHPLAREWIKKLDNIQPSLKRHHRQIPDDWYPEHAPWNPIVIAFVFYIPLLLYTYRQLRLEGGGLPTLAGTLWFFAWVGTMMIGIPIGVNWRRLGRLHYSRNVLLLLGLLFFALPGLGAGLIPTHERNLQIPTFLMMIALGICVGIGLALPLVNLVTQQSGYNRWDQRDFRPMLNHRYEWGLAWVSGLIIIIICSFGAIVAYFRTPMFVTLQSDNLTMTYPSSWRTVECNLSFEGDCLRRIKRSDYTGGIFLTVVRYPRGNWQTPSELEEARRNEYFLENPDHVLLKVDDISIAGYASRMRDTWQYTDTHHIRYRRIYTLMNDWVYYFHVEASQTLWDGQEADVIGILNTISFQ